MDLHCLWSETSSTTQFNYWILIAYINKLLSACDSLAIADLKLVKSLVVPVVVNDVHV